MDRDHHEASGEAPCPTLSVVLVDDHAAFRDGLARTIARHPCFDVLGQAPDADAGLAMIEALGPDLAIVDLRMPGGGGEELARRLAARGLARRTRLVVLTALAHDAAAHRVVAQGVAACLSKELTRSQICDALLRIASRDGSGSSTP